MELLILALIAAVAGYLLAGSKYRKNIDQASGTVTNTSKDLADRSSGWAHSLFGKPKSSDAFKTWAAGPGSVYLPEELISWLTALSAQETKEFTQALGEYMKGLGYDTNKLVKGELDNQPALMQVYVETIVIYSQAYRKAKQERQKPEAPPKTQANEASPANDGVKPAEKSLSRRRAEAPETSEVPQAV